MIYPNGIQQALCSHSVHSLSINKSTPKQKPARKSHVQPAPFLGWKIQGENRTIPIGEAAHLTPLVQLRICFSPFIKFCKDITAFHLPVLTAKGPISPRITWALSPGSSEKTRQEQLQRGTEMFCAQNLGEENGRRRWEGGRLEIKNIDMKEKEKKNNKNMSKIIYILYKI